MFTNIISKVSDGSYRLWQLYWISCSRRFRLDQMCGCHVGQQIPEQLTKLSGEIFIWVDMDCSVLDKVSSWLGAKYFFFLFRCQTFGPKDFCLNGINIEAGAFPNAPQVQEQTLFLVPVNKICIKWTKCLSTCFIHIKLRNLGQTSAILF